jgi:predicted acetyltransferase
MTKRAAKPSACIDLIPATPEQEPILANLLELYAHDFSEFVDVEIGEDGRFGYKRLPLYWSEAGRHPSLVRVDGKLAGLVLVKRGSEISGDADVWDMAEFFVLRGYRRRGIGTELARRVWREFPGRWEVRVMQSHVPAQSFWAHAVAAFTGESIRPMGVEMGGRRWKVFAFESGHRADSSATE